MAIKKYKPTSPARRFMSVLSKEEITKKSPEKALTTDLRRKAGRNAQGKITVRHHGGGARKQYRIIDFKRNRDGIVAKVTAIEYDPNRTANIALLTYADGLKSYILAPLGLKVGDEIISGAGNDIKVGNALPISDIPVGTLVHNVEFVAGKGGQICRSAGTFAQLMAKENGYAQLRLPSGEVRMVALNCKATIGQIGNLEHENVSLGKAGRKRHMGWRPSVRGVVMNPNDHPHGGGEGKSPVGMPSPMSPWGKPTMGRKTRKHKNASDKLIVKRRNSK